MTRREARMIAEEHLKLESQYGIMKDVYLTKREAADMLRVSTSYLDHHPDKFPRKKVGNRYLYSQSVLSSWLQSL
jgi:hypothetical protein